MEARPLLVFGAAAALGAAAVEPFFPVRLLFFAAIAAWTAWPTRRDEPGRIRVLAALALVAGALSARLHHAGAADPLARPHTVRIACTVLDARTCAADDGPVFAVELQANLPAAGTHVLLRGRLEPLDAPRNPGEPDEREIGRERGVTARMSNARMLRKLPRAPLTFSTAIARAHGCALAQLQMRLTEPYASILAGELWGERATLAPELRAEFQETGTVHVLVTAGLHLGVVALAVLTLLRLCTVPRIAACIGTSAVIWAYAVFSGLHVPSIRAAAMATFALAAHAAGSASRSWNAYGAAMLIVALIAPLSVASASFALSFSCVGAILLCADELHRGLQAFALPEKIQEALSLALATQLGTWPLTASLFLLFSPYALLANLLVVPFVGATMILGAAQLALALFPPLAQAVANVNGWLLAWIVDVVQTISALPDASLGMVPPPAWTIAAYDAALIGAMWCWKRDGRTLALSLLFLGATLVATPPRAVDHHLRITVLDVGQADGIVIQTPLGHTILVDAGGRLERGADGGSSAEAVGERIVVPFLRRAGVHRIDALILSHPHGDHVGGFAPIMRDGFSVTEFADGGQQYGGYAYRDAVATARADRIPIVYPRAGMVWRTDDGVTITFIGPSLPFIVSNNQINDNSVAFILQYKHFRMLFTGDAGVAAEQRFLSEGIDLHANVLKVGHHGSRYSSSRAFIAAVHPKYAIISVGLHNMFGHPAPSTIEALQDFGTQVYRTDENGAVQIATDGVFETFVPMLP
ncbi:MAG TPA: DNA internalization-related competence protein ComEC/Rec2 [Candidatus Baltobacteraceae bacterium]|nr:DNA internalization-related competence protein ComEC/Rec2 [Candidatus Baltobacteraceae bacterium]